MAKKRIRKTPSITIDPDVWEAFKRVTGETDLSASQFLERLMMAVVISAEQGFTLEQRQVIEDIRHNNPRDGMLGAVIEAFPKDAISIMKHIEGAMLTGDIDEYLPQLPQQKP